ncbi:hypothetical protein C7S18_01740 [Ahniella affigens]|uniref:Uncharacterized protein n=1 Tax=Ahniella affigens TaxID=2021234 RepID=A0A2P1PMC3_9GAMM|nr:hypothetical protein [Ahniella affigens]AVP95990.1 hypothetical protein C7S18_01740 [Ahniella affigens]
MQTGAVTYRLGASYNHRAWDFQAVCVGPTLCVDHSYPRQVNSAGLGWMIRLGELCPPFQPSGAEFTSPWPNDSQRDFLFGDQDGTEYVMNCDPLVDSACNDGTPSRCVLDGYRMRLDRVGPQYVVRYPNGTGANSEKRISAGLES